MKNQNIYASILWVLGIFVISYIAIFYNLDKPAIRIWDEAIYANNALEMAVNDNYFVLTNNGEQSLYNTKPPLAIWLQSGFIKLLGGTTLAVRLPSALAGLLTCVLLFFFARRRINTVTGVFAVLFLITSVGFTKTHMVRTGDLDSVLVFFVTAYTLLFFDFLLRDKYTQKQLLWYIYGMAFLTLGAYMTKSVAALLPIPGLFIGMLLMKKGKILLTNIHTYIAVFLVLLSIFGYYYFREQVSAGYWDKVVSSEFLRFNTDIMPWHKQPYWYYLMVWRDSDFVYYVWFLPLSLMLLFSKNITTKNLGIIAVVFCVSYFFLLSHPYVKIHWYAAPMFPIMCLLLAMTLGMFYNWLVSKKVFKSKRWVSLTLALSLFIYPYYRIYENNLEYLPKEKLEYDGYAVRRLARYSPEITKYKVLATYKHSSHADAVNFYIKSLNHFKNYELSLKHDIKQIQEGDMVLTSQEDKIKLLESTFSTSLVEQIHGAFLYQTIKSKRIE